MTSKASPVLIICMIVSLSLVAEVESLGDITVGIPPGAANYAINKVDSWFSCSLYDGYAGCYFASSGQSKRDRYANDCSSGANVWDYKHTLATVSWGGNCYCYKCK
jgi:hypothetical protein